MATSVPARGFGLPLRSALWHAALWTWLPALLPVGLGLLQGCDHCLSNYWRSLPIVPGVIGPVLLHLDGAWFFVVGGALALALCSLLALLLRELPPGVAWVPRVVVAGVVALQGIGFAMALRA
jgi:hypothetical protein